MQKSQFEKAEPIVQKIRELEEKKAKINLPAECYQCVLATKSAGTSMLIGSDDVGNQGVIKLVSCFIECIDIEIVSLNKRLEEI